ERSLSATLGPARSVILPADGETARLDLELTVQATGTEQRPVDVALEVAGPDGWTVTPRRDEVKLRTRGNARPAERTVAVSVQVPAGLEDGRYSVTATATGPSGLSFAAEAEILITRAIDFDTGTADEIPWLWDAGGSASNGPQNRFADGTRYFVY